MRLIVILSFFISFSALAKDKCKDYETLMGVVVSNAIAHRDYLKKSNELGQIMTDKVLRSNCEYDPDKSAYNCYRYINKIQNESGGQPSDQVINELQIAEDYTKAYEESQELTKVHNETMVDRNDFFCGTDRGAERAKCVFDLEKLLGPVSTDLIDYAIDLEELEKHKAVLKELNCTTKTSLFLRRIKVTNCGLAREPERTQGFLTDPTLLRANTAAYGIEARTKSIKKYEKTFKAQMGKIREFCSVMNKATEDTGRSKNSISRDRAVPDGSSESAK